MENGGATLCLAVPVVILVAIMFLVVSSLLWKAARNNPVEALKHE